MSMRTVELVTEWDSVPFDGGYDGLRTLADREFSGAVVSGSAQLFMLNGRVVGILEGDLETFENGSGTARQAPHDALPLLVVMQARADEPRAQYYTEDTPISDVDRTLTDGKFTGYVELSENVLSGDYYLVYHQGRSMSVAWVGSSQRLITDDEAFEQADDEVGIYEVMPAEIEPIELPDPEPDTAVGGVDTGGTDTHASETATDTSGPTNTSESADASGPTNTSEPTNASGPADTAEPVTGSDDEFSEPALETDTREREESSGVSSGQSESGTTPSGPPGSKAAGASQGRAVDDGRTADEQSDRDTGTDRTDRERRSPERDETATSHGVETESRTTEEQTADTVDEQAADPVEEQTTGTAGGQPRSTEREAGGAEPATREPTPDTTGTDPEQRDREPTPAEPEVEDTTQRQRASEVAASTQASAETQAGEAESTSGESTASGQSGASAAALETRSIPSLDPELSSSETTTASEPTPDDLSEPPADPEPPTGDQPTQSAPEPPQQTEQAATAPDHQGDRAAELAAELDEREARIRKLEGDIDELAADNEELAAERDRLQTELEEARAEIRRLEAELDAAETPAAGGVQLSAAEAIDGTNLFIRYKSKGEATLAKAGEGGADRSAVEENLRLEYHTQFDAEDAVVDGVEFEAFLEESIHYRFVNWLVRNLLYEIRDTGHANAMSVLYGALPEVDRAELNGNVSVVYTENGQENREQEQFDVVVRDRMGNPLVVANINDSRQPATDGQMTDIVQTAERVGNSSGSLAAAFLVTSSFFEPEALETAEEATSSGLFSRDKNKSFVNLSRKDGYHLCLLEARNDEFHLAVPEL